MLPLGVTIPATVTQRSEIPEGPMNYPVLCLGSLYLPTLLTNSAKVIPAEIVDKLHTITKSNSNFRVQKKPANGFDSNIGESSS
jgi:hypothetical protein